MPVLWLVRHVPTALNAGGRIMGRLDAPPLPDGLARAREAGPGILARTRPARIVASPLRRAAETARAIAPDREIELDARLAERAFGDWEGADKAELARTHPEAFGTRDAVALDFTPPGAEPLDALLARVRAFLAEVDQDTLAVTHNGVIRAVRILQGDEGAARRSEPHLEPIPISLPAPG